MPSGACVERLARRGSPHRGAAPRPTGSPACSRRQHHRRPRSGPRSGRAAPARSIWRRSSRSAHRSPARPRHAGRLEDCEAAGWGGVRRSEPADHAVLIMDGKRLTQTRRRSWPTGFVRQLRLGNEEGHAAGTHARSDAEGVSGIVVLGAPRRRRSGRVERGQDLRTGAALCAPCLRLSGRSVPLTSSRAVALRNRLLLRAYRRMRCRTHSRRRCADALATTPLACSITTRVSSAPPSCAGSRACVSRNCPLLEDADRRDASAIACATWTSSAPSAPSRDENRFSAPITWVRNRIWDRRHRDEFHLLALGKGQTNSGHRGGDLPRPSRTAPRTARCTRRSTDLPRPGRLVQLHQEHLLARTRRCWRSAPSPSSRAMLLPRPNTLRALRCNAPPASARSR